jgi:hypothetical protein
VAEILVREAVAADLPQIAAVALATGQDEEWGGADLAYMTQGCYYRVSRQNAPAGG